MARLYRVPADTSEKEKIIGGVLTLAQGGWCALGLIVAGILFIIVSRVTKMGILALLLSLPVGGAIVYFFAFHKVMELPLLTYLIYRRNMMRKTQYLINDLHYQKPPRTL